MYHLSKTLTQTDTFNIHGMKDIQGYFGLKCPPSNCITKLYGLDTIT